jgi:hypothetical protein
MLEERQADLAGRAIAVLGEDDLGAVLLGAVRGSWSVVPATEGCRRPVGVDVAAGRTPMNRVSYGSTRGNRNVEGEERAMKSITVKLVVGMLASLTATGMMGGAAFAASLSEADAYSSQDSVVAEHPIGEARDEALSAVRDRQWRASEILKDPQSVTDRFIGWVSHARAAAGNLAREAQRQAPEGLDSTD